MSDETIDNPAPTDNPAHVDNPAPTDNPAPEVRYDFVLDKYRADGRSEAESLELQAKSYAELQSKFGAFTGAPEAYEVSLSDELIEAGVQLIDDDPMLANAQELAKELNMSQEGFGRLVNMYAEMQLAEHKAMEDQKAAEMAALGPNANQRIEGINNWIDANMDAETAEGLRGLVQSAAGINAVEQLIARTGKAPVAATQAQPAPSVTAAEVQAMQFEVDPNSGQRRIQVDPEFKKEYERKMAIVYGTGEHRQIIGG
jgi:hypothetical protein